MLHTHPQFIHFGEIRQHKVNGIVDIALVLILCHQHVREYIPGALQQIVTQEKTSQGMLDTTTHLHQILENAALQCGVILYVHNANCDEQIQTRHYRVRILHQLVQIRLLVALLAKVQLQVAQLVRNGHVCTGEKQNK